jgi:hypothetical protein
MTTKYEQRVMRDLKDSLAAVDYILGKPEATIDSFTLRSAQSQAVQVLNGISTLIGIKDLTYYQQLEKDKK